MSKSHAHKKDAENAAKDAENKAAETQNEEVSKETGAKTSETALELTQNGKEGEGQNTAENENQAAEPTAEEKISDLEAQAADLRDQLLRKAADFDNFRKRMNQEKQNAIEYANQSLLLDIIPIIDDFERAIDAGEKGASDMASFLEGVKMIEKRLTSQLDAKWGLKRFDSAGQPFDPNMHEALMMEKSPDVKEATVEEDLIKGYLLKERVIRAAKVKVLMPENE